MGKKVKNRIPQAVLHAVAKAHLGRGSEHNTSLFSLAANALEKLGVRRPLIADNKSRVYSQKNLDRAFVNANAQYLNELYPECKEKVSRDNANAKKYVWGGCGENLVSISAQKEKTESFDVTQANPVGEVDVTGDAFLKTYKWRQLRMMAIKLHGPRCQCCGASAETGAVINVDHIKPRRQFPELALVLDNLQVLCADCNHGKGNWDRTDWRTPADTGVMR